jgi:hypothetical protein
MAVFQFIEGFYNPSRRHSALGYLSPIEYPLSDTVFGGRKPVLRCREIGRVSDLLRDCRQFIPKLGPGFSQGFPLVDDAPCRSRPASSASR